MEARVTMITHLVEDVRVVVSELQSDYIHSIMQSFDNDLDVVSSYERDDDVSSLRSIDE